VTLAPVRCRNQLELGTFIRTVDTIGSRIRVADFKSVLRSAGDVDIGERELAGSINVTSSDVPVLYGAYYLGPDEVAQINHTIATELVCCLLFASSCS
jgi:hypothetical protein